MLSTYKNRGSKTSFVFRPIFYRAGGDVYEIYNRDKT